MLLTCINTQKYVDASEYDATHLHQHIFVCSNNLPFHSHSRKLKKKKVQRRPAVPCTVRARKLLFLPEIESSTCPVQQAIFQHYYRPTVEFAILHLYFDRHNCKHPLARPVCYHICLTRCTTTPHT